MLIRPIFTFSLLMSCNYGSRNF